MAPKPIDVEIRANGVDGVRRQLRLVSDDVEKMGHSAEGMSHSTALGLGELGRAMGNVARQGELGAFAMREFTGAAFRLGAAMGAGGVGTAIGLSVIAVGSLVEWLSKAGEGAKKLREEWDQTIDALVHGTLAANALQQQRLYSGDALAIQKEGESPIAFLARSGGQQALESELARLTPLLGAVNKETNNGTTATTAQKLVRDSYMKQLDELNELLKVNDLRLVQVSESTARLMKVEAELAAFRLKYGPAEKDARQQALYEGGIGGRFRFQDATPAMFGFRPGLMSDLNGPQHDDYIDAKALKIKAAAIPPDLFAEAQGQILKQWQQTMRSMQDTMVDGIANTLATALSDAFRGNFAQIGADAEAGLGAIIENMGQILVRWGTAMLPLAGMFSKDPLTAGLEAIAIGVLLEGLGKALGAAAHGGHGSAGGFGAGSAYGAQQSVAGQGNVTIVVQGGQVGWNLDNPDDLESFNRFLETVARNQIGSTNVRVVRG